MSAKNMRLFFVETLNCDNKVVFDKLNVRNELSNWPFQNETNTIIRSARQSEFMLELASPFSTFHLIRKQGKLWTVLCVYLLRWTYFVTLLCLPQKSKIFQVEDQPQSKEENHNQKVMSLNLGTGDWMNVFLINLL